MPANPAAWRQSFEVWVTTPSFNEPRFWHRTRDEGIAERLVAELRELYPEWEVEMRRLP